MDTSKTVTLESLARQLLKCLERDREWEGGRRERYPDLAPLDNLPAKVVSGHTAGGYVNMYIQGMGGPPWKRVKVSVYIHSPSYSWATPAKERDRRLSPDEEARVCAALKACYPRVLWDEKGAAPGATTIEWEVDMKTDFDLDWRARGPDGREGIIFGITYSGPGAAVTLLLMRGPEPSTLLVVTYPGNLVKVVRQNKKLTEEEKELKGLLQMGGRQAYLKTLSENARQQFLKDPSAADYWGAWKLLEQGQEVKIVHEKYERKEVSEVQWNHVEARANLEVLKARMRDALDLVEQVMSRPGVPARVAGFLELAKRELLLAQQHVGIAGLDQALTEGLPRTTAGAPAVAPDKAEAAPGPTGVSPEAAPTPAGPSEKADEGAYYLADGRGPYATVQEAMDALGVDRDTRPRHNRYERLSAKWKTAIIRKKGGEQDEGTKGTGAGPSEG